MTKEIEHLRCLLSFNTQGSHWPNSFVYFSFWTNSFFFFSFLSFFLAALHGTWDLGSPTRDQLVSPALKAKSLNHWTTREVLGFLACSCGLRNSPACLPALHTGLQKSSWGFTSILTELQEAEDLSRLYTNFKYSKVAHFIPFFRNIFRPRHRGNIFAQDPTHFTVLDQVLQYSESLPITFKKKKKAFYFEMIIDLQEFADMYSKVPLHPSPSLFQC